MNNIGRKVLIFFILSLGIIFSLGVASPDLIFWRDSYLYKEYYITSTTSILCPQSTCSYIIKDCPSSFKIERDFNYIVIIKENKGLLDLFKSCDIITKELKMLSLKGNISQDVLEVCNPYSFDIYLEKIPILTNLNISGYIVINNNLYEVNKGVVYFDNPNEIIFSKSCKSWEIQKIVNGSSLMEKISLYAELRFVYLKPLLNLVSLNYQLFQKLANGKIDSNVIGTIIIDLIIFFILYIFVYFYNFFKTIILDILKVIRTFQSFLMNLKKKRKKEKK